MLLDLEVTSTTGPEGVFLSNGGTAEEWFMLNGGTEEGEYTILGGTRAYAGETGSGHVQITQPGLVWVGTKITVTYS